MKKVSVSAQIHEAVRTLRAGGVIAFPTETTYGLACDPRNATAIKKIFRIKGRSERKPLQLIASSFAQVNAIADLTVAERRLAKRYWPGPLTLLVHLKKGRRLARHVQPKGLIGIRVTSGPVAQRLVKAFGHPLAATSANRSKFKPAFSGRRVERAFHMHTVKPDFILDTGRLPRRKPTTVARVREDDTIEVLRRGAIRL